MFGWYRITPVFRTPGRTQFQYGAVPKTLFIIRQGQQTGIRQRGEMHEHYVLEESLMHM